MEIKIHCPECGHATLLYCCKISGRRESPFTCARCSEQLVLVQEFHYQVTAMKAKSYRNEGGVKKEVKSILKANYTRLKWFMPVQMGYGATGASDFLCNIGGLYVAIETKYAKNELTPNQRLFLVDTVNAGGVGLVINERNVGRLKLILDKALANAKRRIIEEA